jgi:hypothetical protein
LRQAGIKLIWIIVHPNLGIVHMRLQFSDKVVSLGCIRDILDDHTARLLQS